MSKNSAKFRVMLIVEVMMVAVLSDVCVCPKEQRAHVSVYNSGGGAKRFKSRLPLRVQIFHERKSKQ